MNPRRTGSPAGSPAPGSGSGPEPTPSLTKYAKIQPAIAIKPKPVAGSKPESARSTFNPRYDPQLQQLPAVMLHDEALGNINTLRKWVVPPRPRPGRKPVGATANANANANSLKLPTATPGSSASPPGPETHGSSATPPVALASASSAAAAATPPGGQTNYAARAISKKKAKVQNPAGPGASPLLTDLPLAAQSRNIKPATAPKSATDLQLVYLARLKEQELIRNYIDILTNQIKELKFVQSGVITFDVLNTAETRQHKLPALQQSEQLEHINNVHDLDKFLAYLTTQSNVIHSVTKKFVGDSQSPASVLQQINQYLERRALQRTLAKHANPRNGAPASSPISASTPFTPSLLQPLTMNMLDLEDDVIDVEAGANDHPVVLLLAPPERGLVERHESAKLIALDAGPDRKSLRRIGCGFCGGDNPCLCFDADSIFGDKL